MKGTDGLTAFQRVFSASVSSTSHAHSMGREDLVFGGKEEEGDKFLDSIFCGIKEGPEEFIIGTLAWCVVRRHVKRRSREDAADPVFFNSIRWTLKRLLPDDEPRGPRERPSRVDVRPVHTDLPPPINREPIKPRQVYIRNSVELARYARGCVGCDAAKIQGPSRDHTLHTVPCESSEPCLQMLISARESGKRTKECHVQYLMRNQA